MQLLGAWRKAAVTRLPTPACMSSMRPTNRRMIQPTAHPLPLSHTTGMPGMDMSAMMAAAAAGGMGMPGMMVPPGMFPMTAAGFKPPPPPGAPPQPKQE